MILGIGLDVVELSRIEEITQKQPRFAERILTPAEFARYNALLNRRQVEYLAGRFATKEAFSKAVGTGIGELSFQDIEILNDERGKPIFTKLPVPYKSFVSITHTQTIAAAQVVLEGESTTTQL